MLSEINKKQRKAAIVEKLGIFESEGLVPTKKERVVDSIKKDFSKFKKDNCGQGAAEYILLFGGVILIALAGLLIYRSYFRNNASGLNATEDISSIRANMTKLF